MIAFHFGRKLVDPTTSPSSPFWIVPHFINLDRRESGYREGHNRGADPKPPGAQERKKQEKRQEQPAKEHINLLPRRLYPRSRVAEIPRPTEAVIKSQKLICTRRSFHDDFLESICPINARVIALSENCCRGSEP